MKFHLALLSQTADGRSRWQEHERNLPSVCFITLVGLLLPSAVCRLLLLLALRQAAGAGGRSTRSNPQALLPGTTPKRSTIIFFPCRIRTLAVSCSCRLLLPTAPVFFLAAFAGTI